MFETNEMFPYFSTEGGLLFQRILDADVAHHKYEESVHKQKKLLITHCNAEAGIFVCLTKHKVSTC